MIRTSVLWCRRNLFLTAFDTALSLTFIPAGMWIVLAIFDWSIEAARWNVIADSFRVLMVGIYPPAALWRAWLAATMISSLAGATIGSVLAKQPSPIQFGGAALLLGACASIALLGSGAQAWVSVCILAATIGWIASSYGRALRRVIVPIWLVGLIIICAVLAPPGIDKWGGLLLSVLMTIIATILSFPVGVLLALGRRSRIASIRICCTAYIEFVRSVPLLAVVYWTWIVVPLVLPANYDVPDVARGIVGFSIFFAAYAAEYVRGGLQSVPEGHIEGARALGLNTIDINRYVVLPQAFRAVLPALVGNMLDIFNNIPLVFIIGLTDFLRAGQAIISNPLYGGREYEIYTFLFAVYLLVAGLISFTSRKFEIRLGLGVR